LEATVIGSAAIAANVWLFFTLAIRALLVGIVSI
jgi:carbonic anhydrase/acetyltransferase-like protein (isoleucine patch superfamily)